MRKQKILVCGYFGYITNQIDGQTIKTRNIFKLVSEKLKNSDISYFDSQLLSFSKWQLFKLLHKLCKADYLVYLPGKKNLKYIFPIIYYFSKILNIKIIYSVVGGWLADYLNETPKYVTMMQNLEVLLVETCYLKRTLENKYAFTNVTLFPNFRITNYKPVIKNNNNFNIVFMARITEKKGVEMIFDFVEYYSQNKKSNKAVSVNFYGPIDIEYKNRFEFLLNTHDMAVYNGIVEPENVYEILNKQDLLVLPTYYEGEGCPGSIIDAYISGIPVVVSKWKNLPEFVEEGLTGYIFNLDNKEEFFNYIIRLIDNPVLLYNKKKSAINKSKEYTKEYAWRILQNYIKEY